MCDLRREPCYCQGCQRDWEAHFEGEAEAAYLNSVDPERNGAIPASDREWREFLDRLAPIERTSDRKN